MLQCLNVIIPGGNSLGEHFAPRFFPKLADFCRDIRIVLKCRTTAVLSLNPLTGEPTMIFMTYPADR